MRIKATQTAINRHPLPTKNRQDVFLDGVSNALLRFSPNGEIAICARWREDSGKYRRRVVGHWRPDMKISDLRHLVEKSLPTTETITLGDLIEKWKEGGADSKLKTSRTKKEAFRRLEKVWKPLHGQLAHLVTDADIMRVMRPFIMKGQHRAVRAYVSTLSRVYRWARASKIGSVDRNPCRDLELAELLDKPKKRDNVLTPAELLAMWTCLEEISPITQKFIRAQMVLGCRAGELSKLRWDDVTDDMITFRKETVKMRVGRTVPVTPMLRAILDELPRDDDLVFGGLLPNSVGRAISRHMPRSWPSGPKGERDSREPRLHDVRRLLNSYLAPRYSIAVLKMVLGHSFKGSGDVTLGHYTGMTEDLAEIAHEARLFWEKRLQVLLNEAAENEGAQVSKKAVA